MKTFQTIILKIIMDPFCRTEFTKINTATGDTEEIIGKNEIEIIKDLNSKGWCVVALSEKTLGHVDYTTYVFAKEIAVPSHQLKP